MSQRSCCVPSCSSTREIDVTFHRFPNPKDPNQIERFRTWVMRIGGDIIGRDNWFIYKNRRICHNHFEDRFTFPNKRITKFAIPSLNLTGPYSHPIVRPMTTNDPQPEHQAIHTDVRLQSHRAELWNVDHAAVPAPSTSRGELNKKLDSYATVRMKRRVPMTKMEIELKSEIAALKNKLRKVTKAKNQAKRNILMAEKLKQSKAFNMLSKKMSAAAQTFFKMQIGQFGKKPKGRRFSLDEKILALSLYKPSPKAYKILSEICILPKRKSLDKLIQKVTLLPGINEILFENLKRRVNKLPRHQKVCAVIFDEMSIAPNVTYDKKNDKIVGFVDNGQQRDQKFADHVLVFMVRGVIKKFKQPVSFTFCKGTTATSEIVRQVETVIKKVNSTGLRVVSTICDQGSTNMAAVNNLINKTKANYLRAQKSFKGGFFEINKQKVFPLYDPPHLMKGIRNNLLTKDLLYTINNKESNASWAHIQEMISKPPTFEGMPLRLGHKLTAQHVMPNLIPKMRVKHCTQVFSASVGKAMGFMSEHGMLPPEAKETAKVLLFFDDLFDSVNGNFSRPLRGKIYRSAVTKKSPHTKLWLKSLPILKTMKYCNKRGGKGVVPSITSWIKTIEGFQKIVKYLNALGLNSLLLRHFNQDPLENFFGSIRAHGVRNIMPTAMNFVQSYKALLINNLTSPHSVGANCEADDSKCLQSLKYFLTEKIDVEENTKSTEIYNTHFLIDEINSNAIITSNAPAEKEKCAAIAYCSGWVAKSLRKIYKKCNVCQNNLESKEMEEFHSFIKAKEYECNKTWLCYPTRQLFDFFCQIKNICDIILKTCPHSEKLICYIKVIITINLQFDFINCPNHKDKIQETLIQKSVLFFVNIWCKEINCIMNGNIIHWDKSDVFKNAANEYYLKHKKRYPKKM